MAKQVTVSAPGKLMLFGEHAVVQGKPCLVTSVDQRLKLNIEKIDQPLLILEATDVNISNYQKPLNQIGKGDVPKGALFIEIALRNFLKKHKFETGVMVETSSEFKSVFGFGSSSASTVCILKALSELFNIKITNKELFEIAYQTVIDIQGVGSGFDLAAAIYGRTLFYVYPGKVIEPVKVKELPLIVGYTGVKADTATLVKEVNQRAKEYPGIFKKVFDGVEEIVLLAKEALIKGDLEKLGQLMNLNQGFLEAMGVGSDKLSELIYAARNSGAYGAKLSGAGGGDCMIALAPKDKREAVEQAITKASGQVMNIKVNVEGGSVEL